jgi:peptide/nickel transport system ATP-binding protein
MNERPLVEVRALTKHFGKAPSLVHAVEDVGFSIMRGEVVGLVGESGSGKSTIGRLILRAIDVTSGSVLFDGKPIEAMSQRAVRPLRRRMQMVFQDPYASLNPRLRVSSIIGEAIDAHGLARGAARTARIAELLTIVGLEAEHASRFPHEFSGGQRQRIGIARALAVEPDLIVADEPVSALDVSVQAQVLNLLQDLRLHFGMAMLFISHDLDVIRLICDRIVVLYLGRVMEIGPADKVCGHPEHPYTQALLAAVPRPDPDRPRIRRLLHGDMPSPMSPPSGCVFRTRCPHAVEACASAIPPLRDLGAGHVVACIREDLPIRASDGQAEEVR